MSLHYPPRRNFGRRRWDRFAAAVGIGLGFVLAGSVLTLSRCNEGTVSAPTPVATAQPAQASAPAPAPTATPTAVGEDPKALDLTCFGGAQMVATYNGPASFAEVETWDTDFDNQNPQPRPNLRTDLVAIGKTVTRTFKPCRQGDAAIKGGKESGCFWDKNGNPFIPSQQRGKVEECRLTTCQYSEWSTWTEWSDWKDEGGESLLQFRTRTRTRKVLSSPWDGTKCPDIEEQERETRERCLTPRVTLGCEKKHYFDDEYHCTATSTVPSYFSWDPDYVDAFAENTVQSCKDSSKEDFKIYKGPFWDLEKLKSVTVTAKNCQCPNNTGSATWWRNN